MDIKSFFIKRSVEIIVIFFIMMTILFLLFHFAPGDPVSMMVDPSMTSEDAQYMISQLGLDKPLLTQYLVYLKNFFQGNLGNSFYYGEPVIGIIGNRLPNTILLFTTSIIISAFAGVFLGKIAAWHKGEKIDTFGTIAALVCHTLFLPWTALIIIWVFGYKTGLFPLGGMLTPELWINPETNFLIKGIDIIYHMTLPLFTLCIIHFGSYMLIMRSSMLDVMGEDYILTAKAKGVSDKCICNHHIAPNASLPVVTSIGLSLAFSVNGGALTEIIFSWPGLGRELIFAVTNNDYPLALASFLFIAIVVLIANFIVDILYTYLDPRIKY
ncbi:MAG: ABC transporter permease [Thermodesulfobacteriota bacterium]|nr:ABC transporter permease [Thermodesulfobacteriota bacterium]